MKSFELSAPQIELARAALLAVLFWGLETRQGREQIPNWLLGDKAAKRRLYEEFVAPWVDVLSEHGLPHPKRFTRADIMSAKRLSCRFPISDEAFAATLICCRACAQEFAENWWEFHSISPTSIVMYFDGMSPLDDLIVLLEGVEPKVTC